MTTVDFTEHKEQYWRDGYTVIRGAYGDDEVAAYREECDRLWSLDGLDDDLNLRTEFRRAADGHYVFDRIDPVLDISPKLTEAAKHPVLMNALSVILGGSAEILKCKLIQKDPGVSGYIPHQDFLYWRWLEEHPDLLCTAVINLYPSDERSGGIGFYRGGHQELVQGPPGDLDGDCDPELLDASTIVFPALNAGDALIFHSLTPHYSGRNDSEVPRTVLLPSYCVTDDADLYQRYYRREIDRRCREMVGFERYFERNSVLADR